MFSPTLIENVKSLNLQQKALLSSRLKSWLDQAETIQPIPEQTKREGVALTAAQRRLYDMCSDDAGFLANVVSQKVTLEGPLNVSLFEKSVNLVAQRHTAFTLGFGDAGGVPVQSTNKSVNLELELIDLREAGNSEERTQEIENQFKSPGFDLVAGPLFRITLVSLSDKRHILYFATHNLVFDALSYAVFMQEIKYFYNHALGKSGKLPAVPEIDFLDYAAWQRNWQKTKRYRNQLEFWHRRLDFAHGDDLRLEHPRGAARQYKGQRINFELSVQLREQLAQIGKTQGATRFMTFLAAIQSFLAHDMDMRRICIGTINANRSRKQLENVIGYFINLTPISIDIDPSQDRFIDVVNRTKQESLAAIDNADVYFEEIVDSSGKSFEAARNPYFDVLFSFENLPPSETGIDGVVDHFEDLDKGTARYDLSISLYDEPERFHGWIEFNSALFSAGRIKDLIRDFSYWVEAVTLNPDRVLNFGECS